MAITSMPVAVARHVNEDTGPRIQVADPSLVSPPSDDELYSYFGAQQRWIQLVSCCAFLLAAGSLARFTANAWYLAPLYLVLALNVVGMVASALSGWNPRRLSAREHDVIVDEWLATTEVFPTVDVFLPTCGEDLAVLRNTYTHVAAMRWWSDVTVWVLDDADRAEVALEAARFGFRYVVRPDRGHLKKAGNLRHAFGLSSSDLIAIFDADFCPRPDYLVHLVPHLQDEGVGIVQSPQYFATTPSMTWLERTAGATQELFYRWIQPSRDAVDGAICVGTCAVYRRSALEAIDGFAQIEHSEDVHTGIFLLRAGFVTRYVPIVVSRGLCPDRLEGFLNQQYRWCNGSITLLRSGQAHREPLTWRQRICFWAGFLYYLTTAVNVFAIHVPGMLMAVFFASEVRASHFVPFLAGIWVYFALMPRVSTNRWRFEVLRVQMAYSFAHALAVTHKVFGRTQGWVATGAVGTRSSLARTIALMGTFTIGLTLLVSWAAVVRDISVYGVGEFWPMVLFLGGYTYLGVPLLVGFLRVLDVLPPAPPRAVDRTTPASLRNRIARPEVGLTTLLVVLVGLLASGTVTLPSG